MQQLVIDAMKKNESGMVEFLAEDILLKTSTQSFFTPSSYPDLMNLSAKN